MDASGNRLRLGKWGFQMITRVFAPARPLSLRNSFVVGVCGAALLACASPSRALAADGFAFTPVEADNGASGFSVTSIAISNLNQIAITTETGIAEFSDTAPGADPTRLFSQVTDFQSAQQQINGINASHNAVGFFNDAPMLMGGAPRDLGGDNGTDGFIMSTLGGSPMVLVATGATALVTQAFGINDENAVAGDYQTSADGKFHGFIETGGVYTAIDVPGAFDTFAQGINNDGDVVGYFDDSLGHRHGFIESGGVYTTFDEPSANAGTTKAFGINDAGDIVGTYQVTDRGGQRRGRLHNHQRLLRDAARRRSPRALDLGDAADRPSWPRFCRPACVPQQPVPRGVKPLIGLGPGGVISIYGSDWNRSNRTRGRGPPPVPC
jgi:probable HAF family extracellular repeat protein